MGGKPGGEAAGSKGSALEQQLGLPAGSLKTKRLKEHIRACLEGKDMASLTAKLVRCALEERLSLAKDALKPQKEVLAKLIDEVLKETQVS